MTLESRTEQKIVSIGGGTGQFTLLNGLVDYNRPDYITGIAGTWDDGGSSGRLRVEKGVLPPGDARQLLVAFSEKRRQQRAVQGLFNDRSQNEHSAGNLIITYFRDLAHGDQEGLDWVREMLLIDSDVVYVTSQDLTLHAKTRTGIELVGESQIDMRYKRDDYNPSDKIESIYFDITPKAAQRALRAIEQADKIVFPSGSLYGSLLPHLLVEELPEAIIRSKAKLIIVANLMTEKGQTDNYKASDHLEPFLEYLEDESRVDYLIVNDNHLDPKVLKRYEDAGQIPVELDEDACRKITPMMRIIRGPIASYTRRKDLYRHDHRLAQIILELD